MGVESGTPGADPPLEYRHSLVILSDSDHQQMQQDIRAARAIIQTLPLSEASQPAAQPQIYAQLEMG